MAGENPSATLNFFVISGAGCYLWGMFSKSPFRIKLPVADPLTKSRNFLISVDGRSSNRNVPASREHCDVFIGLGSFVFLRVIDRDNAGSVWVYETDFVLFPEETVVPDGGFEIKLLA